MLPAQQQPVNVPLAQDHLPQRTPLLRPGALPSAGPSAGPSGLILCLRLCLSRHDVPKSRVS